jgi:sugar lactone lactonase YvrE
VAATSLRPAQEETTVTIRLVNDHRCILAEGPTWDAEHNCLYWVDIQGKAVHAVNPDGSGFRTWPLPDRVGSMGICRSGKLVVALTKTVHVLDTETGALEKVADVEADVPHTRLNDGKVGPDGAFWVGTMDERPERQPIGNLYRVSGDGTVEKKVEGVYVSNGLAWSGDGRTMFYSDSRGPWIDRFDFDKATGALSNRTRIATLDEATGRPDGGAGDMENCYWSAGISAQRLNRFDRSGKLLSSIDLPVAAPTMPCFGGPDMKTVFVTSLTTGVPPERMEAMPWTGKLIALEVDVVGAPVAKFEGR